MFKFNFLSFDSTTAVEIVNMARVTFFRNRNYDKN